ncbi:fungal-specific transcription factor domain-containing protein [Cadophora sp. MPI-SDFR-AT-0126]|nr:fungal-specific transcription factor domain-containing protein [Leotiomycetes sp. MPI-SDFR-AT-0126]
MELGDSSLSPSPMLPSSDQNIAGLKSAYGLPERQLADSLIDRYFNRAHPLYPFVHEATFRAEYENAWANSSDSPLRPSWYALLNIILALGCEFNDEIPVGEVTNTVSRFVANSRCIILTHIYKKGNLEFVQALLILCHYLQGTLRLNECWNLVGLMIRTAFSIGLQLNPIDLPLPTVDKEMRKRVWWGCFIIDRTVSMKFGRPPSIQEKDAEAVPLPLVVDDQYINNQTTNSRQPTGRPSITAFFVHTIKLSKIIESALRILYTNKWKFPQPTESEKRVPLVPEESNILGNVILLDGQLQSWWRERPIHLSQEPIIAEGEIFQRQQNVLRVRYMQIRILIQRPLLSMFSRQPIEDDFFRAITIAGAQTCILAAHQTVRMICDLYHRGLLNSSWYNLYYMFTSIGVLFHAQSMDNSKLALLGNPLDQKVIECGMEFLKAATSTESSCLASRYTTMLRRFLEKPNQDHRQGQEEQVRCIGTSSRQSSKDRQATGKSPTLGMPAPAGDVDFNNEIGLDDFIFDDLFFDTGIPYDIPSLD